MDPRFHPSTETPIRSAAEAFGVKPVAARPDFRNGPAAHEPLPYCAPMRGPSVREVHSQVEVDRRTATQALQEAKGQALDHEAVLAHSVELSTLRKLVIALQSRLATLESRVDILDGVPFDGAA